MPYIKQEERVELASLVDEMKETIINGERATPGTLNYLMTILAHAYLERKGLNYVAINDVMGVFSAAQAEFYRRVAAPYEDKKIAENGDV